ncbi:MAG TPA: VOC family protein [Nocardioidaceae bacterium]
MLIDHLVYAAPDLDVLVSDVEQRLGVAAVPGGRHEGLGTHNALLALGPRTYLELIAPDPTQPEPATPRPFGVDGVSEARLVAWALACDDIVRVVESARREGFDPGDVVPAERATPSGLVLRWRLTTNALSGGVVPFLIDWGDTPHPASKAPTGAVLDSFRLEHPEAESLLPRLRALRADVEVRPASRAGLVAQVTGPGGTLLLR